MESAAIARAAAGGYAATLLALDLPPAALAAYYATLDDSERERATRYHRLRDRTRFIARRGAMRAHLARLLDAAPGALCFAADEYGKPFLRDDRGLTFNLSHSNGMALLVTARARAIGCDLEWRNPALACPAVAHRLFAPEEQAALAALPAAQWTRGFFNCWTRKEAYVKALGVGLTLPLDSFGVSVAPGEPARLLRGERGWALTSFEPAPGYQAAVVIAAGEE